MQWLSYDDAVPWLTKQTLEYFGLQQILKISKLTCILSSCLPAPEVSHNKGNDGGFMKMTI